MHPRRFYDSIRGSKLAKFMGSCTLVPQSEDNNTVQYKLEINRASTELLCRSAIKQGRILPNLLMPQSEHNNTTQHKLEINRSSKQGKGCYDSASTDETWYGRHKQQLAQKEVSYDNFVDRQAGTKELASLYLCTSGAQYCPYIQYFTNYSVAGLEPEEEPVHNGYYSIFKQVNKSFTGPSDNRRLLLGQWVNVYLAFKMQSTNHFLPGVPLASSWEDKCKHLCSQPSACHHVFCIIQQVHVC